MKKHRSCNCNAYCEEAKSEHDVCGHESCYCGKYVKHTRHKRDKTDLLCVALSLGAAACHLCKERNEKIFFLEGNKKTKYEKCDSKYSNNYIQHDQINLRLLIAENTQQSCCNLVALRFSRRLYRPTPLLSQKTNIPF